MSRFISKRFDGLREYVPGEQPLERKYVKLNTNESPFSPSPKVIEQVCAERGAKLNLYPDPNLRELRSAFAKQYGISADNVVFGNGSDEILSFCFMAFCDDKTPVAFADVTYNFYRVFAKLYNVDYKIIPLMEDLSICVDDYIGININSVIANPNAPTGILLPVEDIAKIVESNPDNVIIVDEAYIDFGGISAMSLTEKYDNLIVVGTFSKSKSLAGARLGYAVADKRLIADLNKMRFSTNPYNINRITAAAGVAAIESEDYYVEMSRQICDNREYLSKRLATLDFYMTDSSANFVFAAKKGFSGKELYSRLKDKGILIRYFDTERTRDYIRITIGTREQIDILLNALEEILSQGGSYEKRDC